VSTTSLKADSGGLSPFGLVTKKAPVDGRGTWNGAAPDTRKARPKKHQSPRSTRLGGGCCLGRGRSSVRPVCLSAGDVATSWASVASISTYVQGTAQSPTNPGNNFCKSAIESVTLLNGVRPVLASGKARLANRVQYPCGYRVPPFPVIPAVVSDHPAWPLRARLRFTSRRVTRSLTRTGFLPGRRGLPMSLHRCACGAGHSRVRCILCELYGPLQEGVNPPATFPFELSPLKATIHYETPR
jgi:hypothetical protein